MNIDSKKLIEKINSYPKDSIEKINDIIELTKLLVGIDIDEYKKWVETGLKLSKKLKDEYKCKVFERNLAQYHITIGEFSNAIEILKECIKYFEKNKNERDSFISQGIIGNAFYAMGLYDEALASFTYLAEYSRKMKDNKAIVFYKINMAGIYSVKRQYKKSIKLLEIAIKEYFQQEKEIADKSFLGLIYSHFGANYKELREYKEAIDYHMKSMEVFKEIGYHKYQLVEYIALGEVSIARNQYKAAIAYLDEAEQLYQNHPFYEYAKEMYQAQYNAWSNWKNSDKAYEYLKKIYEISEDTLSEIKKSKYDSLAKENVTKPDSYIYFTNNREKVLRERTQDVVKVYIEHKTVRIEMSDGEVIFPKEKFISISSRLQKLNSEFLYANKKNLLINFDYFESKNPQEKVIILNGKKIPYKKISEYQWPTINKKIRIMIKYPQ